MSEKKKFELAEEKLQDVSGGAKNTTPVASSQKEVAQDINVSGNSVPKYNNVNNGGKQMFVQQGRNTNTNSGINQM